MLVRSILLLCVHQMGLHVVTIAVSAAPHLGQGLLEICRLSNARYEYTVLLFVSTQFIATVREL